MPLGEPPPSATLRRLGAEPLAGRRLYRLFARRRRTPWWFASVPDPPSDGGRFDLPAPDGSCYVGTSVRAATLEGLQHVLGQGLVHRSVLARLALAEVTAPRDAPLAAHLTTAKAAALGVTAALWAGTDRALTQRWAAALHRVWEALFTGVQHDPTGRARAVTLFDSAGEHEPYGQKRWLTTITDADGDRRIEAVLERHGLEVIGDGDLPLVSWHEVLTRRIVR